MRFNCLEYSINVSHNFTTARFYPQHKGGAKRSNLATRPSEGGMACCFGHLTYMSSQGWHILTLTCAIHSSLEASVSFYSGSERSWKQIFSLREWKKKMI